MTFNNESFLGVIEENLDPAKSPMPPASLISRIQETQKLQKEIKANSKGVAFDPYTTEIDGLEELQEMRITH